MEDAGVDAAEGVLATALTKLRDVRPRGEDPAGALRGVHGAAGDNEDAGSGLELRAEFVELSHHLLIDGIADGGAVELGDDNLVVLAAR